MLLFAESGGNFIFGSFKKEISGKGSIEKAIVIPPVYLFTIIDKRFVVLVVGEIDCRRNKFFNDRSQNVCINHSGNLIPELEFIKNFLYIGRKAVKVGFEVGFKLLRFGFGFQIFQAKR